MSFMQFSSFRHPSPSFPVAGRLPWIAAAGAIALGGFLLAAAGASAPAAPRIDFPVTLHDFGPVSRGVSARHDFVVRNTGSTALEILDVRPSCGCTIVAEWTPLIAPGGVGVIPVQLETAQFVGSISKSITVTSNDPAHPTTFLEITAEILTPIEVASPVVVFPALTRLDQVVSRSVRIRNRVDPPVAITQVSSDQRMFRAELREITPGREFELTLTTVPPLREGTINARVTMETTNPEMPELAVQAVATVLPAVQVAPAEIVLTSPKLAAAEKRLVVVFNHRADDLRLFDLETYPSGIEVTASPASSRGQISVTLTFPAGFEVRIGEKMFFRGKTNHPALPVFEVPIVFRGGP